MIHTSHVDYSKHVMFFNKVMKAFSDSFVQRAMTTQIESTPPSRIKSLAREFLASM